MSRKQVILEKVRLGKFVHGGQVIAESEKGKKIFVWGGLPNELVDVEITKKKSSYLEGVVIKVRTASRDRIEPEEPLSYLSTSPWQILTFSAENNAKQAILEESFVREGISNINWKKFYAGDLQLAYRNKQEIGFWGDEEGLHLAHYVRGTHGKIKIQESKLAFEAINTSARAIRDELNRLEVWGGKLKTLVLRASQAGEVVGALFVKEELDFKDFKLPEGLKGIDIYYSTPNSPASVATKELYSLGDIKLSDRVGGINITYDVMSFFQVNLPVFEKALEVIVSESKGKKAVDFYSGVGTIGIVAGAEMLVEPNESNIAMAKENAHSTNTKVIQATSEDALNYIAADKILIVDPPRAGLHRDVLERINTVKPPKVIYLSCNPSTQARDIKALTGSYSISYARGYNFFPRTPHIECLIVLELKT